MSREAFLNRQMDRDDMTSEEFDLYNKELNDIQQLRNKRKAAREEILAIQAKEKQDLLAIERIDKLTEEQVEKMYEDACIKHQDVNGMSFEEWYKQSLKYYTIDDQYNVHARARSSNTVEVIPHVNAAHAKLTILTRIKYKFYDHAVRGNDFAYDLD